MLRGVNSFLFLLLLIPHNGEFSPTKRISEDEYEDPMLVMLDAMEELFGGDTFNRTFYNLLITCMDTADSDLSQSQNDAWQGMIDYWNMNGTAYDPWGGYDTNYKEYEPTPISVDDMIIYEPCDYTSNVAMYHVVTELCARKNSIGFTMDDSYVRALFQGFSMMAWGSAFMHGSHTLLGRQQDNWSIAVTSYVMHQASLSGLENPSPILTDFQDTQRDMTAVEIAQATTDMFSDLDVTEWGNYTDSLDMPNYYLVFSGLVCTMLTIEFEPVVVNIIIDQLAELFNLDEEYLSFITDEYLPELRKETENLTLPGSEHVKFMGNSVGTIFKLIYAFLFQEQVLQISEDYFLCPFMNHVGWNILPYFNVRIGQFQTFYYYEGKFQLGEEVYPGDEECNPVIPHAKWHLESAIGMMDFAYLSDQMHRLLSTYN